MNIKWIKLQRDQRVKKGDLWVGSSTYNPNDPDTPASVSMGFAVKNEIERVGTISNRWWRPTLDTDSPNCGARRNTLSKPNAYKMDEAAVRR